MGDVATGIGGTLELPPLNVDDVKHQFGEVKGYPGILDLVEIIKHGVPVVSSSSSTDPRQAFQYGNQSSVQEHRSTVWEKICEGVRRSRCLVFTREAAAKIVGLRVAPLGAVITHKVIINNYSFDPSTARGEKGGLNRDIRSVKKCLHVCAERPTNALKCVDRSANNTAFQPPYPISQEVDVTGAFRNVRVAPSQAQTFCYMVDDVLVADFRLTFGWAGSPSH